MNKVVKLSLLLLTLVLFLAYCFYIGFIRFNYPTLEEYPIQGIDVSHHQNEINWAALDTNKVKFAFIKATEGGDYKDGMFIANWTAAKKQNIVVGAYHFFTFCKSGEEQAKNFIETVPKENGVLPPVIDLEYGGNCKLNKSRAEVLKEIMVLEQKLYEHYEQKPILYVTNEFLQHFLIGQFELNPIWIRRIFNQPEITDKRDWLFWQYANRGYLEGIEGYVDLNVFNGTLEEFGELIKK